jgi:hypothetical protein
MNRRWIDSGSSHLLAQAATPRTAPIARSHVDLSITHLVPGRRGALTMQHEAPKNHFLDNRHLDRRGQDAALARRLLGALHRPNSGDPSRPRRRLSAVRTGGLWIAVGLLYLLYLAMQRRLSSYLGECSIWLSGDRALPPPGKQRLPAPGPSPITRSQRPALPGREAKQ